MEKASDGPWFVRRIPNSYESQAGDLHTHPCVRGFRVPRRLYNLAWQQCEADAEFMAAARQDVPKLLDEVQHVRSSLRQCWRTLEELARRGTVDANDLTEMARFLSEEHGSWVTADEPRPADVRRLHLTQVPMRPRSAVAAVPKPESAKAG
jgi:hypothetical protein